MPAGRIGQRRESQVQIIVATQSVSPIDRFDHKDFVVTSRSGHESSFLRFNTTDLTEWLDKYILSELREKNGGGGILEHLNERRSRSQRLRYDQSLPIILRMAIAFGGGFPWPALTTPCITVL